MKRNGYGNVKKTRSERDPQVTRYLNFLRSRQMGDRLRRLGDILADVARVERNIRYTDPALTFRMLDILEAEYRQVGQSDVPQNAHCRAEIGFRIDDLPSEAIRTRSDAPSPILGQNRIQAR